MALIIDGHNLIGVLPDIQLTQPDDEAQLMARLRVYRAHAGNQTIIVFFDSTENRPGSAAGQSLSSPGIQVCFSEAGQTADDAIIAYLRSQHQPGQYAVVTNDAELARRARAIGASVVSASAFAVRLGRSRLQRVRPSAEPELHPRDPRFADIYMGFIEAEKERPRPANEATGDVEMWRERLYGDDVGQAQEAARWLGRHGGQAAVAPLRDALTHSDARVRAAALLALGDLGDPTALPDLCDRLLRDGASMAREAAAQSLGRIGDRTTEAALETAAQADSKSKVRKAAREALLQVRARQGRGGSAAAR